MIGLAEISARTKALFRRETASIVDLIACAQDPHLFQRPAPPQHSDPRKWRCVRCGRLWQDATDNHEPWDLVTADASDVR